MKTSIYVACHKKFIKPFKGCRFLKYMEVGRYFHSKKIFRLNDYSGENISHKNLNYNELTALYWIWKNDKKSDIVGLCHYRRYFLSPSATSSRLSKQILKPKEIEGILSNNNIIVIKCGPYEMACRERIYTNIYSALRPQDIDIVKGIIVSIYGKNYAKIFDEVLDRNWNYLLNMLICKKEMFDDYCAWLFPILEALEKHINLDELIRNEKRIFGLWGEYLLSVFIAANQLKVFECKVINIEKTESDFTVFKKRVKRKIRKIICRILKK